MFKLRIFSDFAWPYCYFGLGLVEKLKKDGFDFTVEWMPYELAPDASQEGENLFDFIPREQIEHSMNQLNELGKDLGIHFHNRNKKFNTRRAHLAGYYAKDQGLYDKFSKRVFEAYFVEGINVAKVDVLSKIAEEVGLDAAEMNRLVDSGSYTERLMADFTIADRNAVNVVPTFMVGEDTRFEGIVPYKDFKKVFENL